MKIIKILASALTLIIALALVACVSPPAKAVDDESESYEYVLSYFSPEGAELISHVEGFLVLKSTQSLEELTRFYEDAFVNVLGVHESEINDAQDGIWIFSGVYNGMHFYQRASGAKEADYRERPFVVELRENDEYIDIEILY